MLGQHGEDAGPQAHQCKRARSSGLFLFLPLRAYNGTAKRGNSRENAIRELYGHQCMPVTEEPLGP